MNHTIFAWTGPTPTEGYPAFVNISRDAQGNHTVTVRGPGDGGRQIACATIPVEALEALLGDLAADLYRDDPPGVAIPVVAWHQRYCEVTRGECMQGCAAGPCKREAKQG